ncbi:hypothetical protein DEU56DRAFT_755571 [Suillus clintonianus]|uniref:uncharacterized protein n=1 Tax=Suillus clintonianus TaxID=1904413 RepID=UPI001B882026|nr:uncharacterized protein DEU56DRAFT_755571 [Suillus clintonianus]KAG2139258.1 hypothetical protein DEU56DRAFT_755571 [Suillus clintonianus]
MTIFVSGRTTPMTTWTCSFGGRVHLPSERARRMPFHRISQWTGGFFEDTSLTKIGLEIHLGHAGQPCPGLTDEWYDTDDEGDDLTEGPWIPLVNDPRTTTVVDRTGIHSLMIRFCRCTDAMTADKQLFETGLFPASFTSPKTAFTFEVLDDFLLDNLECGTSAMNYYSKLRRVTSSVFPHLVPDRYRELMRVGRQWRQLKQLKWHGFGHEKRKPKAGELALFCPACRTFASDKSSRRGGFDLTAWDSWSAMPDTKCISPRRRIPIKDLIATITERSTKQMHLGTSSKQPASAGVLAPDMDVSFPIPWWTFKRGKVGRRQMNMDYALCQALSYNTDGIERAFTFYDINCQYHKHLHQRIDASPYLGLPWGMDIIPGIGLWHVHGHQDKCYVRYASNFITWRCEDRRRNNGDLVGAFEYYITVGKGDMIRMSKFLCRKFKEAVKGVKDSRYAFDRLSETASEETLAKWEAEAEAAQNDRLDNPSAMDIYEVKLTKDRLQSQLDEFIRIALTFLGDGYEGYDRLDGMNVMLDAAELESVGSLSDNADRSDDEEDDVPVEFNPETVVIPLPSNIGVERCAEWGVADLVLQEISLREGQANDALHAIRVNLADKAVLFRTTVRSAKSQARSTRAWAQLISLGADDLLTKYRPLQKEDLKATTVVADPNARGQRNSTLAWFWSIDVEGDSTSNDWMDEFYPVHWLRTLALWDRWAEELLLVGREMTWTVEFFIHKSEQWVGRMQEADANNMIGHRCYAARQAQIYLRLSQHAQDSFERTKGVAQVAE